MASLRPIFPVMQPFFCPRLGIAEMFRFWIHDWWGLGRLSLIFPRLYALSLDSEESVSQVWQNAWTPTLRAAMSDMQVDDFLRLQEFLVPNDDLLRG